eukprot:765375-Hanusia_phi.AAC.5
MSKIFSSTLILGEQVQQEIHDVSSSSKSATGHEGEFTIEEKEGNRYLAPSLLCEIFPGWTVHRCFSWQWRNRHLFYGQWEQGNQRLKSSGLTMFRRSTSSLANRDLTEHPPVVFASVPTPYSNNSSKTKNVLLSVNANGLVKHWHMTSMKCLHTINEDPNQCYALDYRADGLKFATAGQDHQVRDEREKERESGGGIL